MTAPMARFWMVWSPQGRAPTHKHFSRETADAEANRLAKQHPGQEFFVLKAMAGVSARDPKIKTIRLNTDPDDKIPF